MWAVSGSSSKQLVGQPVLAGHQRRVFGTGQPLPQRHHGLHTRAPGGHGEGDRTVECVWVVRGVEEQPVDPVHRGLYLLNIEYVGDDRFGAEGP